MDYESVTEHLRAMVCLLDREADGEIRPATALAGIRREVAAALSDTESKSNIPGMSLRAHLEMAIGLSMVCCAEPDVTDALRDVVALLDERQK